MPQKRDDLARGGARGDRSFRGEPTCPSCGGTHQRIGPVHLQGGSHAQCTDCHNWYDTPAEKHAPPSTYGEVG